MKIIRKQDRIKIVISATVKSPVDRVWDLWTKPFHIMHWNKCIEYTLDDERVVEVLFTSKGNNTIVTETFEAEQENSVELQRTGWQAILDNFKHYAETNINENSHIPMSLV